jgi:carbamoyltransferase
MHGAYLGPSFSDREIERILAVVEQFSPIIRALMSWQKLVATRLADGKVIGWFQGRNGIRSASAG